MALPISITVPGCGWGPFDIDITTGGESGSDGSESTGGSDATSLGYTETGFDSGHTSFATTDVDSSTGPSDDSTGATEGASSDGSSSGEQPSVCAVFVDAKGTWHCECDGAEADPFADCGCVIVPQNQQCWCGECPNGECIQYPVEVCGG